MSFLEKKFNGLLNKIVRKKVNKRFGGSLKALISGGAALNFEVGIIFKCARSSVIARIWSN